MPEPTTAATTTMIPGDLRERLGPLRAVLTANGVVQLHGGAGRRPTYRLRFRQVGADGLRRHRSIELGDAAVAGAVIALIRRWRDEHELVTRQGRDRADEARRERRQMRDRRREVQDAGGGGERHRRAVGREFDRAAGQGDLALWLLSLTVRTVGRSARRRPGRPRKGGLILPPELM